MQAAQRNPSEIRSNLFLVHEGSAARILSETTDADAIRHVTFVAPEHIERLISPDLVDAESALRGWSVRFRTRFEAMEHSAARDGVDLHDLDPAELRDRWATAAQTA